MEQGFEEDEDIKEEEANEDIKIEDISRAHKGGDGEINNPDDQSPQFLDLAN